jgi:hypothetical protein
LSSGNAGNNEAPPDMAATRVCPHYGSTYAAENLCTLCRMGAAADPKVTTAGYVRRAILIAAWDDDVINPNPIKAVAGRLRLGTFKADIDNWVE